VAIAHLKANCFYQPQVALDLVQVVGQVAHAVGEAFPGFFRGPQPQGNARHLADQGGGVWALFKAGEGDRPVKLTGLEGVDQLPFLLHPAGGLI
jgi:hypothetical protein